MPMFCGQVDLPPGKYFVISDEMWAKLVAALMCYPDTFREVGGLRSECTMTIPGDTDDD